MAKFSFGVDRAIAFTLLNRGWALVAGPVTLFFVLRGLTPSEQGYYYTFGSVLGLQVFFELGLGFVVLQTASHQMATLQLVNHRVVGDAAAVGRLGRLLHDVLLRFGLIGSLFVVAVGLGGSWFLARSASAEPVAWQTAWWLTVPVFGASIVCNVVYSFLEGLGLVRDVALGRLVQSLVALCGLWLALSLELRLSALVVLHGLNLLVAGSWILLRHGRLLSDLLAAKGPAGAIDWRADIWPFQWRIAVSWMAGYFASQAITPIVFHSLGAVEAGRMGLSLTLVGVVSSAALAWITTKSPQLGALAAQRQHDQAWSMFQRADRQALVVAAVFAALLMATVAVLTWSWPMLGQRFLPLPALGCVAASAVLGVYISSRALYLRAFRREPFMALSVTTGVATAAAVWLTALAGTLNAVAAAYLCVTAVVALAWCRPLFHRCRLAYAEIS